MKRLFLVAVLFFPFLSFALPSSFPDPVGFVTDTAKILNVEIRESLENELRTFARSNGYEIAVLVVPSLEGETVENYAVKVFEKWKIGNSKLDTGVLFLIAIEDRQMRIEVGYGAEPVLTDSASSQILNNVVKPLFKEGKYGEGIIAGVKNIENVLSGEPLKNYSSSTLLRKMLSQMFSEFGFWVFAIPIIIFQLVLTSVLKFLAKSKSWWLGGVALGAISAVIILLFLSFLAIIFQVFLIIFFTLIGFVVDWLVSKYGYKTFEGNVPWFLGGGFGGGSGGMGGFGGFGGGRSGGGGSSGSW